MRAAPFMLTYTVLCTISPATASPRPTVNTTSGLVRGTTLKSFDGNGYFSFKGIRYADAPVGELRFERTRRYAGRAGVTDALQHGNKCLHVDYMLNRVVVGHEDCLFVNVYTPRLAWSARPLPVMLFIHGGGFTSGSGDTDVYGPDYLMDFDVLLVTFNYRLGVFGFVTTGDASAPGNYGLHDQLLALHWVRDNIAAFGGDPQTITIFGNSAGAASVGLFMLSPLAKGLFHRAISQSGATFCSYAASGAPQNAARKLAEMVKCPTDSNGEMMDCLKQTKAKELITAEKKMSDKSLAPIFIAHRPRVDVESTQPFLPEDPHILLRDGRFPKVPWLSGLNQDEGAFFISSVLSKPEGVEGLLGKNWTFWADSMLALMNSSANPEADAEQIYRFYYGKDQWSMANMKPLVDMMSDRWCNTCVGGENDLASYHTTVYRYILDLTGPGRQNFLESLSKLMGKYRSYIDLGVPHVEELLYLFKPLFMPPVKPGSDQHRMVRFMVQLWTSFARTGRPVTDELPMPAWPSYSVENRRHMRLNLQPSIDTDPFIERVSFWKQLDIAESWRLPVVTAGDREEL